MTTRHGFVFSHLLIMMFALCGPVFAESITLQPSLDNTLFEFDPSDLDSPFNSNGHGDFFSAGRNRSQSLLRRGLLQFDFEDLPSNAVVVPGTVRLSMEVVDSPRRDTSGKDRPFWLVPVTQPWGEGTSMANIGVSGAGSGAAAALGDATWLHGSFNPDVHDPRAPNLEDGGYWEQTAVLGAAPVDPTRFGASVGSVPAAPYLGPVVFTSASMESDINQWLGGSAENYGWLLIGDELVDGSSVSSARGFASRESETPPELSFEYRIVPEPSTSPMPLLIAWILVRRRKRA